MLCYVKMKNERKKLKPFRSFLWIAITKRKCCLIFCTFVILFVNFLCSLSKWYTIDDYRCTELKNKCLPVFKGMA